MKTLKELREKTLTPAEKKKREEIAKAIEKDQPDMPMDKKMAIATAQAKKVAEAKKLDEELWKDIETYANKHGGIDKKDMLKVAMMLKKGDRKGAVKYARGLDTDPRDWLLDKMDEGLDEISMNKAVKNHDIRQKNQAQRVKDKKVIDKHKFAYPKPVKEDLDEAMSLSDIRRKKEREERRKKDGRAGETQAQRMQRKVYGNMMGGLKKGYGESVEHDLQESDSDKYRWKDINAALSGAGINPSTILRVLSGLRGKAIKEDLDEAMGPKPPKLKGNSGPYTRQQIEKAAKEAKVDIGAKSRMMMKLRDM